MNKKIAFALSAFSISLSALAQESGNTQPAEGNSNVGTIVLCIVFAALGLLFIAFRLFASKKENKKVPEVSTTTNTVKLTGKEEVCAAIAIALRQYELERTEIESNILTINKVARTYSPWSSKIYGLRQTPNRR